MIPPMLFHVLYFAIINLFILLTGYGLIKRKRLALSWLLMGITIGIIYIIFIHDKPIIRMLSIITTAFLGMKIITTVENYRQKPLTLSLKQWLVFAIGWAGMRAGPFEKLGTAPAPGGWRMIGMGIIRLFAGVLLLFFVHQINPSLINTKPFYFLSSAIVLIGFSLILHFGLLTISAGLWRFAGVKTYLLFRAPARATSLTEFWGNRWNIAFSEMTSITIFRPLKNMAGNTMALIAAFIFSGLLHELALTVPVNSGYGLPLLYFIIQGCAVVTEKIFKARNAAFLQDKIMAKVWVLCWLAIPLPLLFSPQFIKQIIWPLAGLAHCF